MVRPSATKIGKGNTLLYALVVAAVLAWQSIDLSKTREEGWTFKSKEIPPEILTPCLVFMAFALGINIREELLIIAAMVGRNSKAIAEITEQQIQQQQLQESESITDIKSDDTEKL